MKKLPWFLRLLVIMGFFFQAAPVQADGIVIPEPPPPCLDQNCPPLPPFPRPISQLVIRYHDVKVTIQDQLAVTRVDQVFYNPNEWAVEGTYIFPLPADAAVSNFTLWVDGKPVQGKVLDAEQARKTYQEIVNQLRDPALLEYIGRGAIQASIFPIPPAGERRIQLEYRQVLTAMEGLVQYTYPLNTEKFSVQPLEKVAIQVEVKTSQPIRTVYSPSHPVDVEQSNPNEFTASYEANNILPDTDFALYYSLGETEAFHLFTYRDPMDQADPDGFFLLLLAPKPEVDEQPIPKDILLVLDRSGSMEGEKFQQAQQALRYILQHLNPDDRFYLSAFSSNYEAYAVSLRPASEANAAIRWVDALNAQGKTDINRALLEAAAVADPERPTYLIFLTDGLPTQGVVDSQQILNNFAKAETDDLRLFAFGVGYDVDTFLLDSLSQEHHGLSTYVQPGEPLDEILSAFYAGISTPVLTNLELDFGGLTTYDIYPTPLPDLFRGSQVVVTGRYKGGGAFDLTLRGEVNGELQQFRFTNQIFTQNLSYTSEALAGLPRLWATRKIGYLLNKIRLEGADPETVDQIVKLSIRYGIITPYTSYLVTEPMPLGAASQERLSNDAFNQYAAQPTQVSGQGAVEKAAEQGQLSRAEQAPTLPSTAQQAVRAVGSRTFVLQNGIWMDTAFDPDQMTTLKVAFLSPDYFDLAETRPDIAAALALGEKVILVADGKAYEVTSSDSSNPPINLPAAPPTDQPTPQPGMEATPTQPAAEQPGSSSPANCLGWIFPLILCLIFLFARKH